jgi:hypothetical protein
VTDPRGPDRHPGRGPIRAHRGVRLKPHPQSLRGFLRELESTGDLRRIAEPVSLPYELSALMAAGDGGPPAPINR